MGSSKSVGSTASKDSKNSYYRRSSGKKHRRSFFSRYCHSCGGQDCDDLMETYRAALCSRSTDLNYESKRSKRRKSPRG